MRSGPGLWPGPRHGLPGLVKEPSREVPAVHRSAGTHRARPVSTRSEPVYEIMDLRHRCLAYSFPQRPPDPPHLAVLAHPGFVRAAPVLPGTTLIRLPLSFTPCCDRTQAKVSHLRSNNSASRRRVAQPRGAALRPSVVTARRTQAAGDDEHARAVDPPACRGAATR